jgi:hypothetical protein
MNVPAATTQKLNKAKRYLRFFLQDTPQLNRLIREEESDDELLEFAIDMALSDWNSTTPLSNQSILNFPSLYMLMHGAAIQVLKMQGIRQDRNRLVYNSAGSSFSRSDKGQSYLQWAQFFISDYEVKKKNFKIYQNVKQGFGGFHSEYDQIGFSF